MRCRRAADCASPPSWRQPALLPRDHAAVSVADTGCGIPSEQLQRAFEPLFTTKPSSQGTRFGLAVVHGFVRQLGAMSRWATFREEARPKTLPSGG